MNLRKRSTTLLVTFLITGLNFADCLIEQSKYDPEKMKFAMEFFNYFENICNECQAEYEKNPTEYDTKYWLPIRDELLQKLPHIEKIAKTMKIELSCINVMYSKLINRREDKYKLAILWPIQFVALDYCTTFLHGYYHYIEKVIDGLVMITETDLEDGRETYTAHAIEYGAVVSPIRTLFFTTLYNPEENTLTIPENIELKDLVDSQNNNKRELNSSLLSSVFGETLDTPGLVENDVLPAVDYNNETLWDSALGAGKDLFESIESILFPQASSSSQGEPSGPSKLIDFLRELEKLKIRLDKPDLTPDEINEIARGFNGQGTLTADLYFRSPHVPPSIIFLKLTETKQTFLANGNEYVDEIAELLHAMFSRRRND